MDPAIYNAITVPHIQASIFNWTYLCCHWRYLDNTTRIVLQTWYQIQRTPSSLRYVNYGHGHIQCNCSYVCSGFDIDVNMSALLLEIFRYFDARYAANLVSTAAHIVQITLCELWPRTYTMYLQLHIFRLQYSTERNCAAIRGISTIPWASHCTLAAQYSAHPPVCATWTVVPDIYNIITAPHIQPSIFNWICLRCHWRYADIWMRVILQSWCQIQRTFSGLRYVNCGPGHMQCNYSYVYSDFNIQVNQSALLLEISRYFDARYNVNLVPYIAHTL
jgi:hypothetical protein